MILFDLFKKEKIKTSTPPKIFEIDGVEYKYVKNPKSKSIKITVNDPFRVKITYPKNCPYKKAKEFVDLKKDWINDTINNYKSCKINENFTTKSGNLIITTGLIKSPKITTSKGMVSFTYPIGADFYSKEIQDFLKKAIKKALYNEAKNYLPKRLNELSKKYNFKYKNISLKSEKTRWGSCSSLNNINLNINLMLLEDDLIDYVLIHELCHTVEKNHKESFWRLVEKCMPDYKEAKNKLRYKKIIV